MAQRLMFQFLLNVARFVMISLVGKVDISYMMMKLDQTLKKENVWGGDVLAVNLCVDNGVECVGGDETKEKN